MELESLDTDWLDLENKIDSIDSHYIREPMTEIDVYFIYIDYNSYIEKIVCEKETLLENCGIDKDRLLQIIQSRRHIFDPSKHNNKKYKLLDLLSYNVDLEPKYIEQDFADSADIYSQFFKVLPIFDDIKVADSIFIFHEINSLFFIFKEVDSGNDKVARSILKTENSSKNITRKVRIDLSGEIPRLEMDDIHKYNKSMKSQKNKNRGTRKIVN